MRTVNSQIQEGQQTTCKQIQRKSSQVIIKLMNTGDKEKILKVLEEKVFHTEQQK